MMGIIEIIFTILMCCAIWFFIFYVKIMCGNKKMLKDIVKKMEKQDKKFFSDGKEVNLKKELNLKKLPVEVQKKQSKKLVKKCPKKNKKKKSRS